MTGGAYPSTVVVTSPEAVASLRDLPADLPGGLPIVPAGTSGLPTTAGRYGAAYEHNSEWTLPRSRAQLIRRMVRTSTVLASGVRYLQSVLTGADLFVRRGEGVSSEAADALEMLLGVGSWKDDGGRIGMSPDRLIEEKSSAFVYGNVALSEAWTYDEDTGLYFPELHRRQQVSYDAYITDESERLLGIRQQTWGGDLYTRGTVVLPLRETLWLVHNQGEGGFDGMSVLRPLYGRWRSAEMRFRQEDVAAHRFAVGMYRGVLDVKAFLDVQTAADDNRTPAQLVAAEVADMQTRLKTLDNYQAGHLITPSWWTIEKIGGTGDTGFDPGPLLESAGIHERAMAEALYTAWLMQGRSGDGGSRSMIETQSAGVENVAVDYMQAMLGALNRQTVRRFLDVNFSKLPGKERPSVGFEGIKAPAWMASAGVFADFIDRGVITVGPEDERVARAQLGLPAPAEDAPSAFDRQALQAGGRLRTERGQREQRTGAAAATPTVNKLVERPRGAV